MTATEVKIKGFAKAHPDAKVSDDFLDSWNQFLLSNEAKNIEFIESRPDIESSEEEKKAWRQLIKLANERGDTNLAGALLGFRAVGMKLIKKESTWILRPIIGANGWNSQEDYNANKSKFLAPSGKLLVELLKKLTF